MCTCVDEIDNSNNNGGVDLMEKRVAVQVDSADVVAVLLERMPATIYPSLNSMYTQREDDTRQDRNRPEHVFKILRGRSKNHFVTQYVAALNIQH